MYCLNYCMFYVHFDWCYYLLDVNFTTVFVTVFIDIKSEYFLPSAYVSLKCLNYFLVIFHMCEIPQCIVITIATILGFKM
jgi:hypothetical protein